MVQQQPTCHDPRVAIVRGYKVKLGVDHGHLVISDGIDVHERKIPLIDRTLRRVIITGRAGYITLSALRWCRSHQVAIITVDPDGELLSCSPASDTPDAPTMRAQALCGPGGRYETSGVDIARSITDRKLARQAEVAYNTLGRDREAREIRRVARFLRTADSQKAISLIEAEAARYYFGAWSDVSIAWERSDERIPAHWLYYAGRKNPNYNGNRYAIDPVNAMLNYAYRMLGIEAKLACLAAGMHPALGFMHADLYDRDSLVIDLIETVRPEVDEYVLSLLSHPGNPFARRYARSDFTETSGDKELPDGTVRLSEALRHEISTQSVTWAGSLYTIAQDVARMVASATPSRVFPRDITSDAVIMKQPARSATIENITPDDVIPDELWSQIESLAWQLPTPETGRTNVQHRSVIAALVYARAKRLSRATVAPSFKVSTNTLERRFSTWRELDAWQKIESVILENATRVD